MGWDDFGVFPGRAALKRLWVRAVCYDVLGEQKEVNLTEAGRIFQLGRHRLLVSSQTPDNKLLSRQPIIFSQVVFSKLLFSLLCVKCPLFLLRPKLSHESVQIAQQGWRGHVAHVRSVRGAGPIPVSKGTVMRAERAPGSIPVKEEPSLLRVPR